MKFTKWEIEFILDCISTELCNTTGYSNEEYIQLEKLKLKIEKLEGILEEENKNE